MCISSHWCPDPNAPDPETPGQKLQMASYIPVRLSDPCLCGSSKAYRDCCRLRRYWYPICPNPGLNGYSLRSPQSATFENVDGQLLRMRLMEDVRLQCTEDTPDRGFWLYWGDPALDDQYGTLCFGDNELPARQAARYLASGQEKDTRRAARNLPDQIEGGIIHGRDKGSSFRPGRRHH